MHGLAERPAGASRHGRVFALHVKHQGRAGIVQEVRDHRANALAGAGRGDRHDVAGKAETLIEAGGRIGHPAQGETGRFSGRDQVPGLADFRDRAPPGRPMRDRLRAGRGSGLNGGRADAGSAARFALQSGPQVVQPGPQDAQPMAQGGAFAELGRQRAADAAALRIHGIGADQGCRDHGPGRQERNQHERQHHCRRRQQVGEGGRARQRDRVLFALHGHHDRAEHQHEKDEEEDAPNLNDAPGEAAEIAACRASGKLLPARRGLLLNLAAILR